MNEYISYLNEGTLTDCVRKCLNLIGYRVGVFVTSDEECLNVIQEFTNGVFRFWEDKSLPVHITHVVQSRNSSYITFNTQSIINVCVYRGCIRGVRLHHILVDKKISHTDIDVVLSPLAVKYNSNKWADYRQQQIQNEVDALIKFENEYYTAKSDVNKRPI